MHRNKEYMHQKYVIERNSYIKIAKELNVSRDTIMWWIKKHDIKPRTTSEACKYGQYDFSTILEEYNNGATMGELVLKYGINKSTIHRQLVKMGYKSRGPTSRRIFIDMEYAKKRNLEDKILIPYIAKEMGIGKVTLFNAFKDNNIKPILFKDLLKAKNSHVDEIWLHNEYTLKMRPMWEIALELKISESSVKRMLKKNNIKIRHNVQSKEISGLHRVFVLPILEKFNINHISSYLLPKIDHQLKNGRQYEIDEYLPDHKIFLEVYGDYWHGENEKVMEYDKIKIAAIENNYPDHKILIIWEKDIKNGIAEKIILDAIS